MKNEFPFLLWLCGCHHHHHHHPPPHQISCLYLGIGRRAGKWRLVFAPILLNDLTFPTCQTVAPQLLLFYTNSDDKPVCTLCSRANQSNDTFILSCWADWPLGFCQTCESLLFSFSFFFLMHCHSHSMTFVFLLSASAGPSSDWCDVSILQQAKCVSLHPVMGTHSAELAAHFWPVIKDKKISLSSMTGNHCSICVISPQMNQDIGLCGARSDGDLGFQEEMLRQIDPPAVTYQYLTFLQTLRMVPAHHFAHACCRSAH